MVRRSRRQTDEGHRDWTKDIPGWLTGIAALATVIVTGVLGYIEFNRGLDADRLGPSPAASLVARTTPTSPVVGSPRSSGQVDVRVTTFGWEGDVLRIDGEVTGPADGLLVAVQPTESGEDDHWDSTEIRMDEASGQAAASAEHAEWYAVFPDTPPGRYRIRVFDEILGVEPGDDVVFEAILEAPASTP